MGKGFLNRHEYKVWNQESKATRPQGRGDDGCPNSESLRVVLSEVFVTIGVEDDLVWVTVRQILTILVTVGVVLGPTVDGEVGRFVDKRSRLGIGTVGGGVPKCAAEVNRSILVRI